MKQLKHLLFVFLILSGSFSQAGQSFASKDKSDSMFVSRSDWQKLKKGVDYSESYNEEVPEKENRSYSPSFGGSHFSDFKYVIYFAVLALIIFLVVRLTKGFNVNSDLTKKEITIENIEEVEEKILETDLDALQREALAGANYRLALRLNFLIIIKLLSQAGYIQWARDKTNWEYYSELKGKKLLADNFREVINSFESSWYGEHLVNEFLYYQSEPLYRALQKQLTK